MRPNGRDLTAAVTPAVAVTPMQEVPIETDMTGIPTYVRVSAVNSHGSGAVKSSSPHSLSSLPQKPKAPETAWVEVVSNTELLVQWEPPLHNGGDSISQYKVEWDTSAHFNSGEHGTPMGTSIIPASSLSSVYDIQAFSVSTTEGKYLSGTFTLSFDGQTTEQLPYDASALVVEEALESLCTINDVSVSRSLNCNPEPGYDQCTDSQGYTWLVTFVDVPYPGSQQNKDLSWLQASGTHRLSGTAEHLVSCDDAALQNCANTDDATFDVGTKQEVQKFTCTCTFLITFMGLVTK
jgi:hypothetical protein